MKPFICVSKGTGRPLARIVALVNDCFYHGLALYVNLNRTLQLME